VTITETISAGGARLRIGPWHGRDDIAELVTQPPGAVASPALVRAALDRCRAGGYHKAVTPALPSIEWRAYLDNGFEVFERLHLLSHSVHDLPPRPRIRLRRAGRTDWTSVLDVDDAAFDPFWKLDEAGLDDAIKSTPSSRFRVDRSEPIAGYALCGRAGNLGYVQRLAVHPDGEGDGLGTALLLDGMYWLRRWRVSQILVNTQMTNQRAVDLYEHIGFRRRPNGLHVFRVDLGNLH
jgi:GNAT superfamily N-acetyltransferase